MHKLNFYLVFPKNAPRDSLLLHKPFSRYIIPIKELPYIYICKTTYPFVSSCKNFTSTYFQGERV